MHGVRDMRFRSNCQCGEVFSKIVIGYFVESPILGARLFELCSLFLNKKRYKKTHNPCANRLIKNSTGSRSIFFVCVKGLLFV